jgi:two-component system CheB/CheR fusion protein
MPKKKSVQVDDAQLNSMHVVGIGASAGGLDAIQEFFDNLPSDTGMAFVIIQHLSPNFKSLMDELLSKHTSMNIITARNDMPINANTIYLNPKERNLVVQNKRLITLDREIAGVLNLPIDLFFHSLGKEFGERSTGIILSGTGTDGSRGIKTIKEAGGAVMVQDPRTAQFDGMPNAAIYTNLAEYILSPAKLAESVSKIPHRKPEDVTVKIEKDERVFHKILNEIFRFSGIDFKKYKHNTLIRRLEKRMDINNVDSLNDYHSLLRSKFDEKDLLFRDFLIGVTNFFRDGDAYQVLQEKYLENIFRNSAPGDTIRIWVVACSTGEEAYSLAIIVDEFIKEHKLKNDYKIFATDVDVHALEYASQGFYPINIVADLDKKRLENYFVRIGDKYQISKHIREKILFSRHNVIDDPPFIRIDLLSCRNVLIYFSQETQQKAIKHFQFSLKHGGLLFLGNSENLGDQSKYFETLNKQWRIYKNSSKTKSPVPLTSERRLTIPRLFPGTFSGESHQKDVPDNFFYEFLVDTYAPRVVFIDLNYNILFATADLNNYLRLPKGVFNPNLLAMLTDSLAALVRNGIRKTIESKEPVIFKGIPFLKNGDPIEIDLKLRKIEVPKQKASVFMLEFFELKTKDQDVKIFNYTDIADFAKQRIDDLEEELRKSKIQLQNAIEELETGNEELQASNEELLASNEELQSTNEELQSVNEELYTVNTEMQIKNKDLTDLHNDMVNLLASTQIATLFLDRKQNIRKFTPSINTLFNLNDNDIGRSIGIFAENFIGENRGNLIKDVETVLANRNMIEKEITNLQGNTFLKRITPFITGSGNDPEGAVITFIDISRLKKFEKELTEAKNKAELANIYKNNFLANMSHEIRTPMNGIIGFAEFLRDPDLSHDDRNTYLNIIKTNSNTLLNLIDDIINISKIEAGELRINESEFNLFQFMQEIYTNYQKLKKDRCKEQVELLLRMPESANPFVITDSMRLRQIISNLLNNALKFTEKGFIELGFDIENEKIKFYVKDTGIGIPPDKQQIIFERFQQSDENIGKKYGGTGLGLAIIKGLVELLQGEVWLESKVNSGSYFIISIPYKAGSGKTKPLLKKGIVTDTDFKDKLILVVEDEETNFNYLRLLLQKHRARIVHAAKGEDAIALSMENKDIKLIILDVNLPDMNGYEIARRIKKIRPQLPIIAHTAYAQEEDREKCLKNGCNDYISKPAFPEELLIKIKNLIN